MLAKMKRNVIYLIEKDGQSSIRITTGRNNATLQMTTAIGIEGMWPRAMAAC